MILRQYLDWTLVLRIHPGILKLSLLRNICSRDADVNVDENQRQNGQVSINQDDQKYLI